jgi:hypothetical protein
MVMLPIQHWLVVVGAARANRNSPVLRLIHILLWLVPCNLLVAPALADGMSGTYVGKGDNSAFLIQIVQTGNGPLTGRYEQVVLQPDGKLDDMNAAITGATDGQTIVITITPTYLLAGSFPVSGTIEGHTLHLSGGGNGYNLTLNLLRSNEADFRSQVAILTNQAAAQRQAKVDADQLASLNNVTQRIVDFTSKAGGELGKFAPTEQRYRSITEQMRMALAREQSIFGSGQAAVARSQIFVAINQAAIAANQVHIAVQSAYQVFDNNSGQLLRDSASVSQRCGNDLAGTPVSTDREAWHSACQKFFDAEKSLEQEVAKLRTAFAQIEGVWTTERNKQNAIVQAASDTAR